MTLILICVSVGLIMGLLAGHFAKHETGMSPIIDGASAGMELPLVLGWIAPMLGVFGVLCIGFHIEKSEMIIYYSPWIFLAAFLLAAFFVCRSRKRVLLKAN